MKLSAAGLQHIEDLDSDHYTYSYDNGTADLTVTPVSATATITGSDSKVYDGTAASLDGTKYSVTLSNGMTYTLKDGDYAFANEDGTIISAPTDFGNYKVVLTDQGKTNIENLTKDGNVNNSDWTFDSNATYDITAQKMAIVVAGEASKVFDGKTAKITADNLKNLTLRWGNNASAPSGVTYQLSADDLEVVDANGNPVYRANWENGQLLLNRHYYIVLKDSALAKIQAETSNYEFSLAATAANPTTSDAIYKIYTLKAALTLSGSQTVNYGDSTALNLKDFTVDFSNWVSPMAKPDITLQDGDLEIVDAGQTENGVPVNVGKYTVKMTKQLTDRLKKQWPSYDFDAELSSGSSKGQDATHNPALYIVQARQIEVTLSGKQTIKYGEANTINPDDYQIAFNNIANRDKSTFDGFKLQASDLTFVTTPGDVGTYQVKLSDSGIARLKALDPNFATNYDWNENVTNARADFEVVQMPVTITVSDSSLGSHQTINYGQTPTINDSDYTIAVKTEDGTTLDYTPVAGDLEFKDGTPSNVGTYDVVLSAQGLQNIENKFGTKNYTYSSKGNGTFEIAAAKGTISLTNNGTPGKTFDNSAASLNSGDYTLTVQTDNGPLTYTLQASDLRFVDASGNTISAPTNVGTYQVELTQDAIDAIEALDGNSGKNYTWTLDQNATYTISAAKGTATLSGNVKKVYDGTAIDLNSGTDPIKVTVSYPGAASGATYTLQSGDYEFVDANGVVYDSANAPVNVGNYTIRLTDQGKANIAKLGQVTMGDSTYSNVDWSGTDAITGTGTYDITARDITVTVPDHTQTETYDGNSKTIDWNSIVPTLDAGGVTTPTIPVGTLTDDDYTIKDAGGNIVTNPTAAGTYTITLNSNGMAKLSQLSSNFNWPTTADGSAKLIINKATATAGLSGSNEKNYDGTAVTTAEVNSNGEVVVTISIPNSTKTITYTLQDGDYTWNTTDGSAPTNAGSYTISLNKDKVLAHLQAAIANDTAWNGNVDLSADDLSGTANYKINTVAATASLSGSNSRDYNGSAVTTSDVNSNGDIKVTISVAGLDHQITYTLHDGDYDWYKDGTKLESAPIDAGTYTIQLNSSALAKLQAAIAADSTLGGDITLAQNAISGSAQYTINKVAINTSLSDNNKQTAVFNNDTVTLDPSNFIPSFDANGVTTPVIPTTGANALTADDFTITDQNGNVVTNPKNAGTYNVSLNSQGLAKLANLSSNFNWPSAVTGHGQLVIQAATADATLDGSNQKAYDGTAVTTAQVNANGGITVKIAYSNTPASSFPFVSLAYVNGDTLLTYTLQDGDYTWNTSDGAAPVNVGHYTISLTNQGMRHIQGAIDQLVGSGNVALTDSSAGTAEFDITPFKINVTVDGSASVPAGTTTIPGDKYSLHYSSGESGTGLPSGLNQPTGKLSADDLEFVGTAPTKDSAGETFTVGYKGGQSALQQLLGDNYSVSYTNPSGNYIVGDQLTQTVQYVDANGEVIKTLDPIKGAKGSEVAFDNAANMPTNWVLADGETAPTSIKIEGGTTKIKIKHATKEISGNTPDDWPKNVSEDDFQKSITRTINVTDPSGHTTTTKQIATLTRTGIKDLVTDLVTWNDWSTESWDAFTTPTIAGYTPTQASVAKKMVTSDTQPVTINITYVANDQSDTIKFVDDDDNGAQVGSTETIHGKTDQTVDLNLAVPEHYALASGQTLPTSYTFGATNSPIVIHLVHQHTNVTDSKDVTRTINVTDPSGRTKTTKQTATLKRTGTKDLVNNKISWGAWNTGSWDAFTTPTIAGYTPTQSSVAKTTVTSDTQPVTINISYVANDQSDTIKFVDDDDNGAQVGTTETIHGKTDQTVNLNLTVPEHYALASGQTLPTSYTFGATNSPIVIHLVHQHASVSDSKTVTRTINVTDPSGHTKTTKQTATLKRTGNKDLVTNSVNWSSWNTGSWNAFTTPTIAGYTPTQAGVAAQTVTSDTADRTVDITYTPNAQTGKISYVDAEGHEIATTPLSGKTGEKVAVDPQAPAGWQIVAGQQIPSSVVASADGIPTVTVKVEHATITVHPGETAPTGRVPGDPSKTYETMADLTKTPTRTIIVNLPDGTQKTIRQSVDFSRTATFDEVTGKATYSDWQLSHSDSTNGDAEWDAYTAPVVDGYTASQSAVQAVQVDPTTADSTVVITYTAKESPNTPTTPTNPTKPTNPTNPTTPVSPSTPDQGHQSNGQQGSGNSSNGTNGTNASAGKVTQPTANGSRRPGRESVAGAQQGRQKASQVSHTKQLPQTGNQNDLAMMSLGMLSATLATALGLGKRRKKHE